ncbi:hypothetical protein ScPMuIL_008695 [Solemya velum]
MRVVESLSQRQATCGEDAEDFAIAQSSSEIPIDEGLVAFTNRQSYFKKEIRSPQAKRMTDTANLLANDKGENPQKLNEFAVVNFDEIYGEPTDAVKSLDCVWKNTKICHDGTMNICYKILGAVFGFPIAFFCGLKFACLSFSTIWIMTPCIRGIKIMLTTLKSCYAAWLRCLMDPFWESCGLLFNNVRATFTKDQPN